MKYRRWMNGEDYLIYEGCCPLALRILGALALVGGAVWACLRWL